jgi:hypothetical protein
MSSAFELDLYQQAYPDGYAKHYWHIARDRLVLDAVRRSTTAGSKCMEIGCGRGHFVTALREAGFDARGVELGRPDVFATAAPFVRTGVSVAGLPAAERDDVNCVLLLDVIEHIEDAVGFLREVRASFHGLTSLVVTAPARPEIWSNYDEHYGHFRRYTSDSLRREISDAGFQVVDVRYFFRALYLAALALARLGTKRGVVQATPRVAGVHRTIASALLLETALLPKGVYGSSLLGVAAAGR